MGAVSSRLVINDGMTSVLRRINKAMGLMIDNFEAVQRASGNSINTTKLSLARQEMGRANVILDDIEREYRAINQQQDSLNKKMKTGTSSADGFLGKIKNMASAYLGMQAVTKFVGLSDTLASGRARLELLVDDGGSVKELENKIFASAQNARAGYTDTMATVSKLGLTAGKSFIDATGKINTDEIIKFQELVNKNFVIGGASATEQASAMYQLTQAMGAGKLQGDEYRSIIENAPLLAKSIEDYMVNVQHAKGSMKDWAAEGKLTADVIKAAVFSSATEVEERFEDMPMTWSQVWTMTCNKLIRLFQPLLSFINLLANNWSVLEPIVLGVATALGIFLAIMVAYNAQQAISNTLAAISAARSAIKAGLTLAEAAATKTAEGAQVGLNAALLACPLTWILLIIIAVIAVIYAVVAVINKATGKTISATGVIVGSIFWLASVIWNTIIGVINAVIQFFWTRFVEPWIGIIEWVLNVFNGGFDSFGDAVKNLLGNIISWFLSLGKVVTKIIDAIFGTNWTGGLNSLQEKVLAWGKNENAITISRESPTIESLTGGKIGRWDSTDAYAKGYSFGEGIEKKISGAFGDDGLMGINQTLGNISGDTSDLADNSDKTKDELSYLRTIAEQEAVNRFTTAEIKVDMTGMTNRIDSSMDIDGVVSRLTEEIGAALSTAAEGVY